MTAQNTRIYKSMHNGWTVKTTVETPELGERRFLELVTCKRHTGEVATIATVCTRSEDGVSYSFVMFQDFNRAIAREKTRATEKNVNTQHTLALHHIESIKRDACEHYGVTATA